MDGEQTVVRDALSDFLRKHSEEESISGIDEIVLSYMVSVLEELGADLTAGEAFDLDGFIEMMDAYLPGFSNVNSAEVCEWMFQLAARLRQPKNTIKKPPMTLTQPLMIPPPCDKPTAMSPKVATSPPQFTPSKGHYQKEAPFDGHHQRDTPAKGRHQKEAPARGHHQKEAPTRGHHQKEAPARGHHQKEAPAKGHQNHSRSGRRSRKSSDQSEAERCSGAEAGRAEVQNGFHDNGLGVDLLSEMFPASCSLELSHCLEVSHGDLEAAAQLILLRQEAGESFSATPPKPHQSSAKKANLSAKEGTNLKKSIINMYSYVDVDEAKKEHRPVMPKYEGRKLTRYLDNKVVSTKGEKFTEVKNAEEEEQRKKTTVNIKPAKQYRFH